MREMDWIETSRFPLQGTRTAKITTVGADGRPHVVPVWFTLDERDLVFSTSSRGVKGRNMTREPRVAVDDETPPCAFASIPGRAVLVERPDDFLEWTTRIAGRYVGADRAAEMGRLFVELDDLLVRVQIRSFVARAEVV